MCRQLLTALVVGVILVGALEMGGAEAKPDPTQLAAMADALKYLQELDKYYSQVSRPRYVTPSLASSLTPAFFPFPLLQAFKVFWWHTPITAASAPPCTHLYLASSSYTSGYAFSSSLSGLPGVLKTPT